MLKVIIKSNYNHALFTLTHFPYQAKSGLLKMTIKFNKIINAVYVLVGC